MGQHKRNNQLLFSKLILSKMTLSIQNTLPRRMSFDLNQFDDDDDCVDYDIEAQWEEALKQFDTTSTFDFEEDNKGEEQTNSVNMDESCVDDDGGIQNTVQRKMSFDIPQFDAADDSFDFEVNVEDDDEEQHDDDKEDEEEEEENNRRCNALAKEIVRIGKINHALDDHLTVLNILKKTKNINNNKRKSSTLTRIQKNTIRLDGLLLNGHDENNSNNDTNITKLLTNEDNSTSSSQNTTTPTKVKVVSNNNPSPS